MDIYRLNIMVSIILFEKNLSCCCSNFYYLLSSLKLFFFIFKGLMAIINNNRPIHDIKCLNWMGKFNSIVSNDKSIELGKTFASKIEIIDAIGTHAIPKQSYILTIIHTHNLTVCKQSYIKTVIRTNNHEHKYKQYFINIHN